MLSLEIYQEAVELYFSFPFLDKEFSDTKVALRARDVFIVLHILSCWLKICRHMRLRLYSCSSKSLATHIDRNLTLKYRAKYSRDSDLHESGMYESRGPPAFGFRQLLNTLEILNLASSRGSRYRASNVKLKYIVRLLIPRLLLLLNNEYICYSNERTKRNRI